MLRIVIPEKEEWDEINEQFIYTKGYTLQLEHSLVSLSKWESKWCKSFLASKQLTHEESIDYIRCMTLTQNVPDEVYKDLPHNVIDKVTRYIEAPMTATRFYEEDKKKPKSREIVTSELIYYWMVAYHIPFKCEKWHLNRLLTLIRVCDVKNTPPKKMGRNALLSRNRALNAARKKQLNTKG